jgi:hypothetical protein
MPTFCRHNRFIERCPVCSKELAPDSPLRPAAPSTRTRRSSSGKERTRAQRAAPGLRVSRESRAVEDGYQSELVPGLRASADAERLAEELAFSAQRLLAIASSPPGVYADVAAARASDPAWATWAALLLVYICPLEEEHDAFVSIRAALASTPGPGAPDAGAELPDPDALDLGPRTAHEAGRGASTLRAFLEWAGRSGGISAAFTGDAGWSPERRFARVFERLALPAFGRAGRYDLLVVLGRAGVYDLAPDSLQLAPQRGVAAEDPATLAAKRVFGIADPLLLDRRATALAQEADVPLAALDLALANWAAPQRATIGVPPGPEPPAALPRIRGALSL